MKRLQLPSKSKQQGVTLIVGLIMLLLMTIMAVTVFRMSTVQTLVVANAQQKARGISAAQLAIDTALSSSAFTQTPNLAIPPAASGCGTAAANTLCVSSSGTNVKDFVVKLEDPKCISASTLKVAQLDLSAGPLSPDISCLSGTQQGVFGVTGAASGETLCATSLWEMSATAEDTLTNTSVNLVEGVGVRILTAEMSNFCAN